jgi:hypothetical protein
MKPNTIRDASIFIGMLAGVLLAWNRMFKPAFIAAGFKLFYVPTWAWVLLGIISWIVLVKQFRFSRLHALEQRFSHLKNKPYNMNYIEPHAIMTQHMLDECYWLHRLATQFALIKTFAQADGTPLLVRTKQLSCLHFVGKRAEDTAVLLLEFVAGDIDSERGLKSISRVNVLHSHYRDHIKMDEMIHTLGMFIFEPIRIIAMFEWRALTELEQVARFVFWREVGLRMGIHGIPNTIPEYLAWIEQYESRAFRYAESNRKLADQVLDLFLRTYNVPEPRKALVSQVAGSLLEDRVLKAIGWSTPPTSVKTYVYVALLIRACMVRYFMLPSLRGQFNPLAKLGKDGRYHRSWYIFEPWYLKDNLWTRFTTWIKNRGRLAPGEQYQSQGYIPETLGPSKFRKLWLAETTEMAQEMEAYVKEKLKGGAMAPFSCGDMLNWVM